MAEHSGYAPPSIWQAVYIGDGIYARFNSKTGIITLWTYNGVNTSDPIHIDLTTFKTLLGLAKTFWNGHV